MEPDDPEEDYASDYDEPSTNSEFTSIITRNVLFAYEHGRFVDLLTLVPYAHVS